jgi:hypothetical protein
MGTYIVWEKQGALCWHLCTMSREGDKTLISSSSGKTFEQGLFQRNQYFPPMIHSTVLLPGLSDLISWGCLFMLLLISEPRCAHTFCFFGVSRRSHLMGHYQYILEQGALPNKKA